jgi:hypothetical protein
MSESKDYKIFRGNVFEYGDRIDRVENSMVAGAPDINMCIEGTELWIEQKSPKEPSRVSTPLFGSNHRISQNQKNWFLRQRKAGGRCYFLVSSDKRWMLLPGSMADKINEMTVSELLEQCIWSCDKPIRDEEQWKQLRTTLKR